MFAVLGVGGGRRGALARRLVLLIVGELQGRGCGKHEVFSISCIEVLRCNVKTYLYSSAGIGFGSVTAK